MKNAWPAKTTPSTFPVQRGVQDVVVLGLGNILLADDGVGIHVVRRLENDPGAPPGLRAVEGGTLGFRLMASLKSSGAVIIIDAAQLGKRAGTIRLLGRKALDEHVSYSGRVSAHEAGLVDLLTLARLDGWMPAHLALLGIQPQRIDWGEALSKPVARALPLACRVVIHTVLAWQAAP